MRLNEQKLRPPLIPPAEAARLLRDGRLGVRIEALARLAASASLGMTPEDQESRT